MFYKSLLPALSVVLFTIVSCNPKTSDAQNPNRLTSKTTSLIENTSGTTISERFSPPKGFTRTTETEDSFGAYLRNFKLKPAGTLVKHYDGTTKRNKVHAAVLDIDTGTRNLQQCADAVMRLRGEYLFTQKKFDELHFNYTNGFNCSYVKWQQGYRPVVTGNNVRWQKKTGPDSSHASFRKYMNSVFSYAGTHSLEKELKPAGLEYMQIGDLFIQGGFPGHAVLVVDLAKNENGEKVFLLAQSYMPAQDIHILKNTNKTNHSPWYSVSEIKDKIYTPEWTFGKDDLKRF